MFLRFGLLLFLTMGINAQENRTVRFRHLTTEDGLSQAAVYAILQDQRGFMWFGTQEGLNRYDGQKFKVFLHDGEDPKSLARDWIWDLLEDKNGNLWIATDGGGLDRYEPNSESFTHFQHDRLDPDSLSSNQVLSLLEDEQGFLWIGTDGGGLNRFDPSTKKFSAYRHDPKNSQSLGNDRIRALLQDSKGRIWIGSDGGGLSQLLDNGTFINYTHNIEQSESLADNRVRDIIEDHLGNLWISTYRGGVDRFNPETKSFEHFRHDPNRSESLSSNRVVDMLRDAQDRLWIATEKGLNLWKQNGFEAFTHDPTDPYSLIENRVISLNQDQGGNIWIGTHGGLSRWNPESTNFAHYKKNPRTEKGLNSNTIMTFEENAAGTWVGTYGGGLNLFDEDGNHIRSYRHQSDDPKSLIDDRVMTLHSDPKGHLWVGTMSAGLDRMNPDGSFDHFSNDNKDPESLSRNGVTDIAQASDDMLWIGTYGAGLYHFSPKERCFNIHKHNPKDPNAISSNRVLAIHPENEDLIWVGTKDGGLNRFQPSTGKFTVIRHNPRRPNSLSSDSAWTIHEDALGNLWIGTQGGGLNLWRKTHRDQDRQHFRNFSMRHGFPSSVIYAILSAPDNSLWVSTNRGLSHFQPNTFEVRNFDQTHGLQAEEYNFGAYFMSQSGKMFFGGNNGFNAFYPEAIHGNAHTPPIVLTAFKKFNKAVLFDQPLAQLTHINLEHDDSVIAFEFAALDYTAPEKNQYKYRLVGFNENWLDLDDRSGVTYTNLDKGVYTFEVIASNNNQIWNNDGLRVKLAVAAAPWETWWAYTLYIMVITALIMSYIYSQRKKLARERSIVRRLQQVDKLKDEFLANTSHELRTPLNGIIGLADSMIDGATGHLPSETQKCLRMIVSSGKRLSALVNDILDFTQLKNRSLTVNKKAISLHPLVDIVFSLSKPLIGDKLLQLINDVPEAAPLVAADEHRLQQILYNLVGNAIKFTESGSVRIVTEVVGNQMFIRVEDTGIGIPEEKQKEIFTSFAQINPDQQDKNAGTGLGLSITRKLVSLHGGQLSVTSTPGQGSCFSFALTLADYKLINAYDDEDEEFYRPVVDTEEVIDIGGLMETGEGKYTILVVDDEPVNRQVLFNHLSLRHYSVLLAENGVQALEMIDESIDLILLDIMMPGISGYEVCKTIRRKYPIGELPIIFLSAKNQVKDLVTGFEAGANDYLYKPFSKGELLSRVNNHLKVMEMSKNLVRTETALSQTQKMDTIGTLSGGIAHDFNNLLTPILGHTELALCYLDKDSKARSSLELVLEAVEQARNLVGQILTFSRRKEASSDFKPVSLKQVINDALNLVRSSLPSSIEVWDQCEEEGLIMGDTTQINQVIMNICTNAYYAMEETGGILEVNCNQVSFNEEEALTFQLKAGRYIQIIISDTGCGMDEETKEHIFDPFFTTKDVGEGTGLGLSVVHGIIVSHGGTIMVDSEVGAGTAFQLFFPALEEGVIQEEKKLEILPGKGQRILFVDDEERILQWASETLTQIGYDVTLCPSAIEAIPTLEQQNFDLLITDKAMSKMTGLELAEHAKHYYPQMPIILITGFTDNFDEEDVLAMGIDALLLKPIRIPDLSHAIHNALKQPSNTE